MRAIWSRLRSRLRGRKPEGGPKVQLVVPAELNRNSAKVTALMPPEQSGAWLLERMRQQLGLESYAGIRILDFGCGVRFSQAILNGDLEIGGYHGVDNFRPLIEFLEQNVRDPRFSYRFLDAHHPLYNPAGQPLARHTELPDLKPTFDVACMFSVITHQAPDDSRSIFRMLRRYVKPDGRLFFTCFLDESIPTFEDRSPEQNGGICFYNPTFLMELVEPCGWRRVASAPGDERLIGDSFVFRPV